MGCLTECLVNNPLNMEEDRLLWYQTVLQNSRWVYRRLKNSVDLGSNLPRGRQVTMVPDCSPELQVGIYRQIKKSVALGSTSNLPERFNDWQENINSYFTCMIFVTIPFLRYQLMTLAIDLVQGRTWETFKFCYISWSIDDLAFILAYLSNGTMIWPRPLTLFKVEFTKV